MNDQIELIAGNKIDQTKWDQCIQLSSNGLIYNTFNYLNAICPIWAGYVVNDYEAVIALPYKRKLNIPYWYTPPFIQQLGFIGEINEQTQQNILIQLIKKHPYGSLLFNHQNVEITRFINAEPKPNFLLNLNQPYPEIYKGYSTELQQHIRKAARTNLAYYKDTPIKKTINLYKQYHEHQLKNVTELDFGNFYNYCEHAASFSQQCFTRTILNEEKEIMSTALLLRDNKRIYNIMNTTTQAGRATAANHYLFDQIIQEFSEEPIWLDFEGSSIPGVQYFYQQFGPIKETYFVYHYNHLPFPLNLLK